MDLISYCIDGADYDECGGAFLREPVKRKTGCAFLLVFSLFSLLGHAAAAANNNTTATTRVPLSSSSLSSLRPNVLPNIDNTTTRESRELLQCLAFKPTFGGGAKMGLDSAQVPRRAINGDHLTICSSQETTCCTRDTENKLSLLAKQDYDRLLSEHVSRFKSLLISRTTKFDDYFTELIRNARHNLHSMFIRTYGPLYEKNAVIFTELFDDLERYYRGNRGHVNLQSTMSRFFSQLFLKMFALLNAQYSFDQTQLSCVAKQMDKVKPFGDVADKLSHQLKRAFTEARTFVQALAIGRDTARTASEISISGPCTSSLTRMMYCPQCRGLMDLKPCPAYCLGVVKSCLGQQMEMEQEWNQFIDALLLVAERLRSPFNIETVVTPIDVKISEAIMNLQEQGENISAKIFMECGKPRLSRRATPASRNFSTRPSQHLMTPAPMIVNLEQLSRDAKEKLSQTKDFWSSLPSHVCTDYGKTFKSATPDDCWNGMTKSKTLSSASEAASAVPSRMTKSAENSDRTTSTAIAQQIQQLKLVTIKLKQAYNGAEVEWIETASDDEDDFQNSSNEPSSMENGSGGSSGDGEITDEPDESDVEGSGTPPSIVVSPVTMLLTVTVSTVKPKPKIVTPTTEDIGFDSTTTTQPPPTTVPATTTPPPKIVPRVEPLPSQPPPPPPKPSGASTLSAANVFVWIYLCLVVFISDWR